MSSFVELSHDAFARMTFIRSKDTSVGECSWCGRAFKKLYTYGYDRDDKPYHPSWCTGSFCGVGCFRIFHDSN